ncbi:kelch repeat-containing protein [Pyrenochaeta sp. MPI-SDFR-AT-0127]|nr:kelch repeat-containing protein [Pyrenochaeta sp. MPI-SDFR-AT-0127]
MPLQKFFLSLFTLSTVLPLSNALPSSYSSPFKSGLIPLAGLPKGARQEHATVYMAPDTIAVVGGIAPNASAPVAPFSSTDHVELYSITKNTWRSAAPLPRPLNHPNTASVNGQIYVFGGMDDGGEARERFRTVPESWVYNPRKNAWSPISPFPNPRGAAALAVHKGKVYIVGGYTELILASQIPLPEAISDLVSVYDTQTSTWVTDSLPAAAKHIPGTRDHARAEVVNGKLFVIGGFAYGGYNQSDTVFILDLQNLEAGWETSSARMPTPRASFASGVFGKKIYTIGGEGNATADAWIPLRVFNDVEVYDVEDNSWSKRGPISYSRQGQGVGVGRKLYIPAGADRQPVGPVGRFDAYVV